jgi:hypothetical protein
VKEARVSFLRIRAWRARRRHEKANEDGHGTKNGADIDKLLRDRSIDAETNESFALVDQGFVRHAGEEGTKHS